MSANQPPTKNLAATIVVILLLGVAAVYGLSQLGGEEPPIVVGQPKAPSAPVKATPVEDGSVTDDRFAAVRKIFEAKGVRAERDPQARNTVRLYLPNTVALQTTEVQAKILAASVRERLGSRAIVYVKSEDGVTIGKIGPLD